MNVKTVLPLVALMGITRVHHFGSAFLLPDASLAVFFLAGLFFSSRNLFVALLVEVGLLDYVAITQFNVSDFCISSAYVFLIPTYFAMWFGGRFSANFKSMQGTELTLSISAMATLFVATTSAFLISNGSFYWLSDKILARDFSNYVTQMTHYYLPYMGYTLMYAIFGFAVFKLFKRLPNLMAQKTA